MGSQPASAAANGAERRLFDADQELPPSALLTIASSTP